MFKVSPKEVTFLYRTVLILLVMLGIALFLILCFIAKIWLPSCLAMVQELPSRLGIVW